LMEASPSPGCELSAMQQLEVGPVVPASCAWRLLIPYAPAEEMVQFGCDGQHHMRAACAAPGGPLVEPTDTLG